MAYSTGVYACMGARGQCQESLLYISISFLRFLCNYICMHVCLCGSMCTPGSGVTGYCQLPKVSECQEPNSRCLQKAYMLLTTESFSPATLRSLVWVQAICMWVSTVARRGHCTGNANSCKLLSDGVGKSTSTGKHWVISPVLPLYWLSVITKWLVWLACRLYSASVSFFSPITGGQRH